MKKIIDIICKRGIRIGLSIFYDIRVSGLDNIPKNGPALIIMNHQSFLDAPIIYSYIERDVKFLAYYKLFSVRLLGKILKIHNDIPIKDKDLEAVRHAFNQCCDVLSQDLLCMFPEGSLSNDGAIHEFKHGIKHLWTQCPTQVIPAAIDGAYETIFSRNSYRPYKFMFRNPFQRRKIYVNIGRAYIQEIDVDKLRSLVVTLQQQIQYSFKNPENNHLI